MDSEPLHIYRRLAGGTLSDAPIFVKDREGNASPGLFDILLHRAARSEQIPLVIRPSQQPITSLLDLPPDPREIDAR
jgi:hypothetical protein